MIRAGKEDNSMQNAKKPSLIDTIDYKRDVVPYKFIKIYAGTWIDRTEGQCYS